MSWYAVRVVGSELKAAAKIVEAGVAHFCPMRVVYWRDRRTQKERKLEQALIPRYQFVDLHSLADYYAVLDVEGVIEILGKWEWGMSSMGQVPGEWITALRDAGPIITGKKLPFRKNDKIRILVGALAGYVGVIERAQGKHSFRVGLENGQQVFAQAVDMERLPQ